MHYTSISIVLCALSLCTKSSVTTDYCSKTYEKLCHKKGLHVACEFPFVGPGDSCHNVTNITMDADLRDVILHYVNWQRQKVALGKVTLKEGVELPQPRYVTLVKWNNELAFLAQRLADQCEFTHDECRATVEFPYAGQTIGEVRYRRSPALSEVSRGVKLILKAWWRERRAVEPEQLFDGFQLAKNRGSIWGDFSQLAKHTLTAMGCGTIIHGRSPKLLFVCDFSTTNMLGEPTLSDGPIGQCPRGMQRDEDSNYPLLCQSKIHQEEEKNQDYDHSPVHVRPTPRLLPVMPHEQYEIKQDYDVPETAETERSEIMTRRQFNIRPQLDNSLAISKLRQKVSETEKLIERPVLYLGRNNNFNEERPLTQKLDKRVKTTRKWPQHKGSLKKHYPSTEAKYVQRLWLFPIDKDDVEQIYNDTGFKLPFTVPSRYEHTTLKRRPKPAS